jgi:hypothetical protein
VALARLSAGFFCIHGVDALARYSMREFFRPGAPIEQSLEHTATLQRPAYRLGARRSRVSPLWADPSRENPGKPPIRLSRGRLSPGRRVRLETTPGAAASPADDRNGANGAHVSRQIPHKSAGADIPNRFSC